MDRLEEEIAPHAERVYAYDRQGRDRSPAEGAAMMDVFVELVKVSLDDDASPAALLAGIRSASRAFLDRKGWEAMMRRGMRKDFSWRVSASEYAALYQRLLDGGKTAASFGAKQDPIQLGV